MTTRWMHIEWHTFGTWLPGDPRGFRSRDHRIHSSGDYRSPPPPGEHAGLHAYAKRVMHRAPVVLTGTQQIRICAQLEEKIEREGFEVALLSVSITHVHLLGRFDPASVGMEVGKLKRHSSHAIRDELPGRIWEARIDDRVIRDEVHWQGVYGYILDHSRKERAAIWRAGQSQE